MGKNPLSTRPFWRKINKFRTKKSSNTIPTLISNNVYYKSDEEKGQLFGELLASTFTPNPDLTNSTTESEVDYEISNFFLEKNKNNLFESITITEIILAINKIKDNSASGPDLIHNLMLKNLPESTLYDILNLFNLSLTTSQIPNNWKKAQVTMIPKKSSPTQDPSNYRPISLTSCLGKLLERIIYTRLYNHIERNFLLIQEQSGFRKHRRTADNLFFLIQKITESFNRKKKICCLFFDISKAFDRVWHDGLIYKMIKMQLPKSLISWTKSFLDSRLFCVNVNGQTSKDFPIKAGVPQGSVISPLLFSIFINDIPRKDKTNNEYSLLFADDLVTFFIYKSKRNIELRINKYLKELEPWLTKWKMKISIEKSCYMIFTKSTREEYNLDLKIIIIIIVY